MIREVVYFVDGKRKIIKARVCKSFWSKFSGLMFRRRPMPLLFVFRREMNLSIHSLFCRPFKAIWLDDKMRSTRVVEVKGWKFNISGRGRYLLEVPVVDNRKI